jgi:hypothetical protein
MPAWRCSLEPGHAPFLADPQRFIQLLDDFRDAHTNS